MPNPSELNEQNQPVQQGSFDATDDERLQGLLSQVAADLDARPDEDAVGLLTLRLADAGIEMDHDEIVTLAGELPGRSG